MVDRSLLPKAVAEAMGVSVDTVGRYAREGLIPFATTPMGHRRFNLDEVRDALADLEGPQLSRLRPSTRPVGDSGSRLVAGPPVRPSASAALAEELRAARTTPAGLGSTVDELEPLSADEAAAAVVVKVLTGLGQGDVVSLGAVNLMGVGASSAWAKTAEHEGLDPTDAGPSDELWSVTVTSDVGWYAVITQDCDIVRHPDIEPALVVCPLKFVSDAAWQALRSGPTSPREFPFPASRGLPTLAGHKLVADLRFVTSVDKTALLHASVEVKKTLTGPQRSAFGRWVGARYARVPHPDVLERDVLPKAADVIRKLATRFAAGEKADPEVRLVGASERWYLGGNDRRVLFIPMLSEATARDAGLWRASAGEFDEATIKTGAKRLTGKLSAGLPAGGGYTCAVEPATLHGTTAANLLEWSEWVVEAPTDPLAEA